MVAGVNNAARDDTRATHRERVLRAMVHIQANLASPLPLDRLAAVAHMSPFHFQRIFSHDAGEGPASFVRRLRLERAARVLRYTTRSVSRIAVEIGYGHRESFVRAFHARFGAAPADYRARSPRRHIPGAALARVRGMRVDNFPELHLAFIRRIGGPGVPFDQFPRLLAWAAAKQRARPEDMLRLGVAHDDPSVTPAARRRFDACVCVAPSVRPEGDIGVQVLGGGEFAVATHRGSRASLPAVRERIARACSRALRRRRRAAPAFEIYLDDARRPVTDILIPVETEQPTRRWYFRRVRSRS